MTASNRFASDGRSIWTWRYEHLFPIFNRGLLSELRSFCYRLYTACGNNDLTQVYLLPTPDEYNYAPMYSEIMTELTTPDGLKLLALELNCGQNNVNRYYYVNDEGLLDYYDMRPDADNAGKQLPANF